MATCLENLEMSGNCQGISHCLESGFPLYYLFSTTASMALFLDACVYDDESMTMRLCNFVYFLATLQEYGYSQSHETVRMDRQWPWDHAIRSPDVSTCSWVWHEICCPGHHVLDAAAR